MKVLKRNTTEFDALEDQTGVTETVELEQIDDQHLVHGPLG